MARRTAPPMRDATVDETDVVRETYVDEGFEGRTALRDRIRWGPVVAGLLTTLVTMVVLTVLGVAIGLSAFDPGDEAIGAAATIWGIISALVAFFAGGLMAASTASPGSARWGWLHGLMVGVTAIAVMLWLVGTGVGNVLGAAAGNIEDMTALGGVDVTQDQAQTAFDTARDSAWGTLIGLLLALGAATIGGVLGTRATDDRGGDGPRAERTHRERTAR